MDVNLMIDIETLSTKQNASIISIGAVSFSLEKYLIGNIFYETISLNSCIENGLTVDESTIKFWINQTQESKKGLFENTVHINEALIKLSSFITNDCCVWGNPSSFDIGILSNAYDKCGIKIPWNYRNIRDLRTLNSLFPELKNSIKREGIHHNAVDDCIFQIKNLFEIYKKLKQTLYENTHNRKITEEKI